MFHISSSGKYITIHFNLHSNGCHDALYFPDELM